MSSPLDVARNDSTVLLVGEQDAFAEILLAHGFDVRHASSAAESLREVVRVAPRVIVIERALPDGDGWDLVHVLKSLSSRTSVKVIALTADVSRRSTERALIAGCDAFLAKPCNPQVLLEEVRRLLSWRRPSGV